MVKLLLDGQMRRTSLYGNVRSKPPAAFDGNARVFTGLRFRLGTGEFPFYSPIKTRDGPLCIDVSALMQQALEPCLKGPSAMTDLPESLDSLAGIEAAFS